MINVASPADLRALLLDFVGQACPSVTFRRGPDLDLGVIGNCQVAGLIDRLGRLVWGCLPRLDADPAFSALLTPEGGDAQTGVFAIDLQGPGARYAQLLA